MSIFKNISLKEGIQDNHIVDILQDEYAYMWIASQRGLDRFDGENTVNFNLYDIINLDDKILNLGVKCRRRNLDSNRK